MTLLLPADAHERAGLRAYLTRVVGLDDRAAVRLQSRGRVLGVWAGPPLEVLALRPVGLADAVALDVTVSAKRLLDRVGDGGVEVPPGVPGPAWAGLLPPRTGWEPGAVVAASVVVDQLRVGVEAFRRRVDALPAEGRTTEAMTAAASEVWERECVGDVPLRVAHAAQLLGLLGAGEGECTAYKVGTWRRLGCPGGSVAARSGPAPGAGLDLFALGLLR